MSCSSTIRLTFKANSCKLGAQAETLVLVHGLTSAGATFWAGGLDVMDQISAVVNVVAVDLRGHGQSPDCSKDDYSLPSMAADLKRFMAEELKLSKCHWLGHSWGSRVVVTLAEQYPEIVSSVFVEDEYIDCDTAKETWEQALAKAQQMKSDWQPSWPTKEEAIAYLENSHGKDRVDYNRKVMSQKKKAEDGSAEDVEVWAAMFKPHVAHLWDFHCQVYDGNTVWRNKTGKYPFRVHIQKAGNDQTSDISPERWAKLNSECDVMVREGGNRSLSVVPEADHSIHRTHANLFAQDILAHLGQCIAK